MTVPKIQKVSQLEIIIVCLFPLSILAGTLIAQAALLVFPALIALSLARLTLTGPLDAAALSGRFSFLWAILSLLLTLSTRGGRCALGLFFTLITLLIRIS